MHEKQPDPVGEAEDEFGGQLKSEGCSYEAAQAYTSTPESILFGQQSAKSYLYSNGASPPDQNNNFRGAHERFYLDFAYNQADNQEEQKLNYYLDELSSSNFNYMKTNNFMLNRPKEIHPHFDVVDENELNELNKIVDELDELVRNNLIEEPLNYSNNTFSNSSNASFNHNCSYSNSPQQADICFLADELNNIQNMSNNSELDLLDSNTSVFLQNSDPMMMMI